ncbi:MULTISPECIES: hypothetical protein [Bacillaceae]|nr:MULTISPECIES: hypothetical protein [Bacillaceae]
MEKRGQNRLSFQFDDQAASETSRQIMDSYNSGVIDPAEAQRRAPGRKKD